MFIQKKLKGGTGVAIVVRRITEERLRTKCFRGTHHSLAGNFSRWNSVKELFLDEFVIKQFLDELSEMSLKQETGTYGVSIIHTMPIGWESTAPIENYEQNDLEKFSLNRKSWGLRLKPSRTNLLAPQTSEITIIFEFKYENTKYVAVVHSIYPGNDIGELNGDVTDRENRVFFDWNHPGEV